MNNQAVVDFDIESAVHISFRILSDSYWPAVNRPRSNDNLSLSTDNDLSHSIITITAGECELLCAACTVNPKNSPAAVGPEVLLDMSPVVDCECVFPYIPG